MDVYTGTASEEACIFIEESSPDGLHTRVIPVEAVASWSELLGYDDPLDALEAIIHVQDHGEPDPDPVTGENAWTEPFAALAERETAREASALQVQGHVRAQSLASPALQARLATVPIADAVTEARIRCRSRLGLLGTEPKVRALSSLSAASNPAEERRTALRQAIAPVSDEIECCREDFLHSLTPFNTDMPEGIR